MLEESYFVVVLFKLETCFTFDKSKDILHRIIERGKRRTNHQFDENLKLV